MNKKYFTLLVLLVLFVSLSGFSGQLTSKAANEGWKGWTSVGGNWKVQKEDESIIINNHNVGEAFYISDEYMDVNTSFSYEFDAQIETGSLGLLFGVENKRSPGKQRRCLLINADNNNGTSFLVKNAKTLYLKGCTLPEMSENTTYRNVKLVYIANSCVYLYVDGTLVDSFVASGFEAGYIGITTNNCNATVKNLHYEKITLPLASNITLSSAAQNFEFKPDQFEYNLYPVFTDTSITVKAYSEIADKITINGQPVDSGEPVEILLNIGYTQIDIALYTQNNTKSPDLHYYFHIHRSNDPNMIYNEDLRSQVHISTLDNLLNDPNGLLYDAYSGEYHLFCQYSPKTSIHGESKAWCHFVSKDLIHWEELGLALTADELGEAWSGSGIIDYNNSSGLFDDSVPPESRMVLIYTSAKGDTRYGIEKVSLAYSKDFGRTWIKYEGNPIIKNGEDYSPEYSDGFRDPKVFWYEDNSYEAGGIWLALVGGGEYRIFSSQDLLNWNKEGSCTDHTGKRKISAECPDLFYLEGKDSTGNKMGSWVLLGSDFNNADSKIFYYIGQIIRDENGKISFTASQKRKELYEGGVIYSTQTFFNDKSGRRIAVSWVREWSQIFVQSSSEVKNWQGLLSWPLELSLAQSGSEYVVKSTPVEEMTSLREELLYSSNGITLSDSNGNILSDVKGTVFEVITTFSADNSAVVSFDLRGTKVTYNPGEGIVLVDATAVSGGSRRITVTPDSNGKINLRLVIDKTVVGVYVNNGESCNYVIAYPETKNTSLSLVVNNGTAVVDEISVYSLNSIWEKSSTDIEEEGSSSQFHNKSKVNLIAIAIGAMAVCFGVLMGLVIKTVIGKKKQ